MSGTFKTLIIVFIVLAVVVLGGSWLVEFIFPSTADTPAPPSDTESDAKPTPPEQSSASVTKIPVLPLITASGGLGDSKEAVDVAYGTPLAANGRSPAVLEQGWAIGIRYAEDRFLVDFEKSIVKNLMVQFTNAQWTTRTGALEIARTHMPRDARQLRSYVSEISDNEVLVFQSALLAERLADEENYRGEPPGTFSVILQSLKEFAGMEERRNRPFFGVLLTTGAAE